MINGLTILFKNRYKIKQKIKKKLAFLSIKKKKKFSIIFIKNFLLYNTFLKKLLILNIKKKKNNVFINFSFLNGKIIKKFSSGYYAKRALKKTFFGINLLMSNVSNELYLFFNKIFLLNIIGDFNEKGLKKNIFNYLKFNKQRLLSNFKISSYKFKAHNGVRKKKKRRK